MTNPLSTPAASNVGLLLARASVGIYLGLVGYAHVVGGVANFASKHKKLMPAWFDPIYAEVFLTTYPIIQVAAGAMLALGVFTRVSAFLLSSTLFVMMMCLPQVVRSGQGPFDPNWIFLAVGVAIVTNGGGQLTFPALLGKKPGGSAPKAPAPAMAK